MIYSPIMNAAASTKAPGLKRLELAIIVLLAVVCLGMALHGRDRRIRREVADFLKNAPRIQQALEAFANNNQGRFPPDAMHISRPQGLEDKYIGWERTWKVDYDVHDNGSGGKFVCLEWCGPSPPSYQGLCQKPDFRRKYGRGQEIPNQVNRIWVVRESASIVPPGGP